MDGRQYVGQECTLDGKRATISGRANRVATVAQLPEGLAVDYSWPTVARVMEQNGGAFVYIEKPKPFLSVDEAARAAGDLLIARVRNGRDRRAAVKKLAEGFGFIVSEDSLDEAARALGLDTNDTEGE